MTPRRRETQTQRNQKVGEYDQEIPQSQTADRPTAPLERAYRHNTVTRPPRDNNSKATNSLFLVKMIAKLYRTTKETWHVLLASNS